ncbi:MAG TPA: extracellular solute-binding protein [Anaerolineae bacterium]
MARLNIMYRTFDGFERALAVQTENFRRLRPDVEVHLEHCGPEELYERMVAQEGYATGRWDIMLSLTDWLPELIKRGGFLPLNGYLAHDPPEDWPDGWSDSMKGLQRNRAGTMYGMAYHDGPEMFHYRSDLFGSETEQTNFRRSYGYNLHVPETWDEFLDVARFFTRPDEHLWGAVVAALPDGHNNVYDFLIHLWSRGGRLLDDRSRPAFNSPEGLEALRFYTELLTVHHVTPPDAPQWDSVLSGVNYAAGLGAMMWNWSGFAATAQLPPSKIIGKNRCTIIPRGSGPRGRHMSLNVYWVLGILAGSPQPDLAWSFLKATASARMDKVTSLSGGTGTRLSTWRDPEIQAQFPYYEAIEEVHRGVESPPAIPEYPALNEVLSDMTKACLAGKAEPAVALRDAAAACEGILADAGYYR